MKRLLWQLQQIGRHIGAMGVTGLVLLLAAGVGYVGLLRPEEAGRAVDAARLVQYAQRHVRTHKSIPVSVQSAAISRFPTMRDIPILLNRLSALASKQGVVLPQGNYSLSPVADSRLLRLEVRFPVQADYPALRGFLATSLAALPYLSLDGFEFKRTDIGASQVTAELRMSFYLRPVS